MPRSIIVAAMPAPGGKLLIVIVNWRAIQTNFKQSNLALGMDLPVLVNEQKFCGDA